MKKIILLLCFCIVFIGRTAVAEENFSEELIEKFELDTIKGVTKLIVVDTTVNEPRCYVLKRFNGAWVCLQEAQAYIGRGGAKKNKIEGDLATPKGLYNFIIAIGMQENPGSILPYYQIRKGDVWVTDPQSKYYNLFVRENTVYNDWLSQIELDKRPIRYAYALVVDYNITHREPYIGSAFFLECSNGKATDGNIGLPRSMIKELLSFVDKETKIYIH